MLNRAVAVLAAMLMLAACGRLSAGAGERGETGPAGPDTTGPADINAEDIKAIPPDPGIWERPLGDMGVAIEDASFLRELAYEPIVPSDTLGAPVATFVSDVEMTGREAQSVAWTFDDADAGRYIVLEMPSGATQADLEEPAHLTPGCRTVAPTFEGADTQVECVSDDFSLVKIRDDIVALVVQNEYVTTVSWLQPMNVREPEAFVGFGNLTLEIRLMAPAGGASLDALVKVANSL